MLGVEALAAAFLGALGRRVAGGTLNQWFRPNGGRVFGDTPARILFGVAVAILPVLHNWRVALLYIPGIWAGTTVGLFDSIGQGRGSDPYWRSFLGLTLHGIAGVALPALAAWWFGHTWWWLIPSALSISPLYTVGWAITGKDGTLPSLPNGLRGATEIGEALWGAAVGLGCFLAVVW